MFYVFMRTWRLWTYSGKMVLCLTISYFLYTLANLLGNFKKGQGAICQIDGFTRTFAIVASFYWAFRIVRSAYTQMVDPDYSLIRRNSLPQLSKGFILPFLFAMIPLISPLIGFSHFKYAPISLACGAAATGGEEKAMSFYVYVIYNMSPAALMLLFTLYYSVRIIIAIRRFGDDIKISPGRFLVYPIGLFIVWLPSLLFAFLRNRSLKKDHGLEEIFWAELVKILLTYSLGFFNAVLYGIQSYHLTKVEEKKSFNTDGSALNTSWFEDIEDDLDLDSSMSNYAM